MIAKFVYYCVVGLKPAACISQILLITKLEKQFGIRLSQFIEKGGRVWLDNIRLIKQEI